MDMTGRIIKGLLDALARLPLGILYLISDIIYPVVYYVVGYRRKVVRRNLTASFPEKSEKEIKGIEKGFYRNMCSIIVETVKLLHISSEEMRRRVVVTNPEIVNETVASSRSAVLLLGHYANWEWVQEISGYLDHHAYMASIYRPINHHPWDDIYTRIRSRWAVNIVPQKSAVRALLDKSHRPWICGFIADQRPRRNDEDNVMTFLNQPTAFIYNPEVIGRKVGSDFFFIEMQRLKRGYYTVTFHPLSPSETSEPYPYMRAFMETLEKVIEKQPELWVWSHKRWK